MINHEGASYGSHVYEPWVDGMGWFMVALALVWIPAIALLEYCRAHGFLEVSRVTILNLLTEKKESPDVSLAQWKFSLKGFIMETTNFC